MNTNDRDQDPTADLLARALAEEAATVDTTPGALQEIQQRTHTSRSARNRWVWAVAGAGLATAAVITGVVLVSGNDSGGGKTPAAGAPSSSVAPQPDVTVTLTYVGPQPGNPEGEGSGESFGRDTDMPRLFTETRTVPGTDQPEGFQAIHEFLTTEPADPDYMTGWPSGVDVEAISTAGGVTTVELRGSADLEGTNELDEGQRMAAIQALVKTVGGNAPVAFVYNDQALSTLFGIDVSAPVQAMSEDDSRAWISIDTITEGQTVNNPVSIGVSGNVFEGNVNWTLTDANGTTLNEGYATTSMGSWTTATVKLGTLDPGSYTFTAYEVSAESGDEINVDTKTFVVN